MSSYLQKNVKLFTQNPLVTLRVSGNIFITKKIFWYLLYDQTRCN